MSQSHGDRDMVNSDRPRICKRKLLVLQKVQLRVNRKLFKKKPNHHLLLFQKIAINFASSNTPTSHTADGRLSV